MSTGTDFIPTVDCMPRKYRYAEPIRFRPAVSVSSIFRDRNGFSAMSGPTRDFENSSTSVRVGKKYIPFRPMTQAWTAEDRPGRAADLRGLHRTTCGAVSS